MQTISGIHYNWSLPDVSSEQYFALIRNFRRHAFLLLYLFGASPALCSSFVAGRPHELQPLGDGSMFMPHGTSLRMGRLGYQSDAQASAGRELQQPGRLWRLAAGRAHAPVAGLRIHRHRNLGGDYNQLATSLLQIENEFYGTIRPKRVINPGERPLHALRERGVEYVEVRLMDLDPFEPVGINAQTMRFLDVFLLHCLLSDSPDDTPQEIADLARNQHLTAARGREPGLRLSRDGSEVTLTDWGLELVEQCLPIAAALDAAQGGTQHADAVHAARAALQNPDSLPSARVLAAIEQQHGNSFVGFVRAQSEQTRAALLGLPFSAAQQAEFEQMTAESIQEQKRIEAADTLPFEIYREQYVSPARLGMARGRMAVAA
jgi:glutamate--cysteine ligase